MHTEPIYPVCDEKIKQIKIEHSDQILHIKTHLYFVTTIK
jgi:hypothetical protein